jgi:hypothetical protein
MAARKTYQLAEEAGERRDAGQREHQHREHDARHHGLVGDRPARSLISSTGRRAAHGRMQAKVPSVMTR